VGARSQPEVAAVEEEERRLGLEEEGLEGASREESFLFFSERGWEVY